MKFVAVTSCPTGIAHSQMAAEGLEQAADALGHEIRVEIQGAMGAEDELTSEEIADADAVVIAADTSVSRDRFEGKPVVKSAVAKAINEAEELLQEAETKAETGDTSESESGLSTSTESEDDTGSEPTPPTQETTREQESQGIIGKLKSLFS